MRTQEAEALNGALAGSIVAVTIWGLTLQEWAAVAAFIYTVWLLGEKVWTKVQAWRKRRAGGE